MGDLKIEISGTLAEIAPIIEKIKAIAIEKMNEAESLDEAKQIWQSYQPFQKDKEFAEAKDNVKKRIEGKSQKDAK